MDDAWLTALDLDPQAWPPTPGAAAAGQRIARRGLRPNLGSPKTAREFTRRTFSAWSLDGLYNDVVVVVSELVTNALCHGLADTSYSALARPVQLVLLARRHRLLTAVVDPSDKTPVLGSTKHFAESGRGLRIVAVMSDSWGWVPFATGGKAVWAAFNIPGDVAPASQTLP
ncbi:MAG TPA: ATP-binding protein [Streptosporangiaceae bacterium]|nr:ATP-binding protein [Streptosporangiaceae bacterium]